MTNFSTVRFKKHGHNGNIMTILKNALIDFHFGAFNENVSKLIHIQLFIG